MAESINPLLTDKLCEGIVTCYLIDFGDKFEMISNSHLERIGLTKLEVREVAFRNLRKKVQVNYTIGVIDYSRQNPNLKPFNKIDMDEEFNPSLLCLYSPWEQIEINLKSNSIAVSTPAKIFMLLTDMRNLESLISIRAIANKMCERALTDGTSITPETFIRKDGKWILFLDTDDHLNELLQ